MIIINNNRVQEYNSSDANKLSFIASYGMYIIP